MTSPHAPLAHPLTRRHLPRMDGSELLQIFRTDAGGPLLAQLAFAASWVLFSLLVAPVYFRVVDPVLRRCLSAWAGEPVLWVLRRGSQHGASPWFSPRFNTWSWGLTPRPDRPLGRDWVLYSLSVLTVYGVVGVLPVAVLCAIAFGTRLLSPPVVLVLFFLVIPLYRRFSSGRWHPAVERLDTL